MLYLVGNVVITEFRIVKENDGRGEGRLYL